MADRTVGLEGEDVAEFLRGPNTVRDGYLTGLSIRPTMVEWDPILELVFYVPNAPQVVHYTLELKGDLDFERTFSSSDFLSPIAMVKCLWADIGRFYLSLDPYDEHEGFISAEDGDCFAANWVRLTVEDSAPS